MKSALAFIALAAVSTATVADFKAIWGLECGLPCMSDAVIDMGCKDVSDKACMCTTWGEFKLAFKTANCARKACGWKHEFKFQTSLWHYCHSDELIVPAVPAIPIPTNTAAPWTPTIDSSTFAPRTTTPIPATTETETAAAATTVTTTTSTETTAFPAWNVNTTATTTTTTVSVTHTSTDCTGCPPATPWTIPAATTTITCTECADGAGQETEAAQTATPTWDNGAAGQQTADDTPTWTPAKVPANTTIPAVVTAGANAARGAGALVAMLVAAVAL
ncbi:CFEM domain-containing protein [Purpureocillium lilacinum]|uniref:CFEM domain-containing protein n=1 Tax=Purpureocillium lilacinum TaxID=33203 RepID=A0A179GXN6_PURLI|nr:CFEM domain-containing protein [Purpureocillium lilacinum]OAQ82736.1 CFEM domain-containing protein [Purpureocillium lilacinum]